MADHQRAVHEFLARTEAKLANSSFMDKAPAEVVEKDRAKIVDATAGLGSLKEQRGKIEGS